MLDAATGQNAVNQAREFQHAANITGIVLTKLDGTPKGGVVIAIREELKIPVKFIGVGEQLDDLQLLTPMNLRRLFLNRRQRELTGIQALACKWGRGSFERKEECFENVCHGHSQQTQDHGAAAHSGAAGNPGDHS